jgi:hypothetical protein
MAVGRYDRAQRPRPPRRRTRRPDLETVTSGAATALLAAGTDWAEGVARQAAGADEQGPRHEGRRTYQAPKTPHALTGAGTAALQGCGPHFKFNVAFDATTTTPKPLPAQLKWSLSFADQQNGWVDFRDLGSNVVAIDPTYGLNEGSTTTSGSCEVGSRLTCARQRARQTLWSTAESRRSADSAHGRARGAQATRADATTMWRVGQWFLLGYPCALPRRCSLKAILSADQCPNEQRPKRRATEADDLAARDSRPRTTCFQQSTARSTSPGQLTKDGS